MILRRDALALETYRVLAKILTHLEPDASPADFCEMPSGWARDLVAIAEIDHEDREERQREIDNRYGR